MNYWNQLSNDIQTLILCIRASLPMVEEVMDARRPNTQEKGSESAIAPVPILATCAYNNNT